MEYLHDNPCRKGLVLAPEDWRFSSARYWLTRETNDVQLSDVGWEYAVGGVEDPHRAEAEL